MPYTLGSNNHDKYYICGWFCSLFKQERRQSRPNYRYYWDFLHYVGSKSQLPKDGRNLVLLNIALLDMAL